MFPNNLSSKLFGALILGQMATAMPRPHPASPAGVVARDNSPPDMFHIYGDSKGPETRDLEEAAAIAYREGNARGVREWLTLLWGFQKCNPAWPASFLPDNDSTNKFPLGQAYTLPYDVVDKKRHEKFANLLEMNLAKALVPDYDFTRLTRKRWWPWALLDGVQAYASDKADLNFVETVTTLSAVETVVLEADDMKDMNLWDDIYSHARDSPIWIKYDSDELDYRVIIDRVENIEGSDRQHLKTSSIVTYRGIMGKAQEELPVADIVPFRIVHLKDFAGFHGTRIGEWDEQELLPSDRAPAQ